MRRAAQVLYLKLVKSRTQSTKHLCARLTAENEQREMAEEFKIVKTNELDVQAKQQVFDLWNNEYPANLSYNSLAEFDNYLQNITKLKHYLLRSAKGQVLGWALTFERDSETWFAIILSEEIKGKGFGKKMLNLLKQDEPILNGWVIDHNNDVKKNGLKYHSPLKFYEKCGFEIQSGVMLKHEKISAVKVQWTKEKQ